MQDHLRRSQSRSAFTLIELLVVIAIIAVLAALTMGVVGRVRENGNRTKCLSNLRQIGAAIFLYTNENNYTLPGPVYRSVRHPDAKPSDKYISNAKWLDPYLGGNKAVWRCPSNTAAYTANAGKLVYILNNQSTTNPEKFFGDADLPDDSTHPKARPKMLTAIKSAGQIEHATVTERSRIWLVSDIDGINFDTVNSLGSSYALDPKKCPPPHRGGRNYLFFDGHSEMRMPGDFPPNP